MYTRKEIQIFVVFFVIFWLRLYIIVRSFLICFLLVLAYIYIYILFFCGGGRGLCFFRLFIYWERGAGNGLSSWVSFHFSFLVFLYFYFYHVLYFFHFFFVRVCLCVVPAVMLPRNRGPSYFPRVLPSPKTREWDRVGLLDAGIVDILAEVRTNFGPPTQFPGSVNYLVSETLFGFGIRLSVSGKSSVSHFLPSGQFLVSGRFSETGHFSGSGKLVFFFVFFCFLRVMPSPSSSLLFG